ncbi:hypothetical protein V2W45_303969 [Cenococcum geophilum]
MENTQLPLSSHPFLTKLAAGHLLYRHSASRGVQVRSIPQVSFKPQRFQTRYVQVFNLVLLLLTFHNKASENKRPATINIKVYAAIQQKLSYYPKQAKKKIFGPSMLAYQRCHMQLSVAQRVTRAFRSSMATYRTHSYLTVHRDLAAELPQLSPHASMLESRGKIISWINNTTLGVSNVLSACISSRFLDVDKIFLDWVFSSSCLQESKLF